MPITDIKCEKRTIPPIVQTLLYYLVIVGIRHIGSWLDRVLKPLGVPLGTFSFVFIFIAAIIFHYRFKTEFNGFFGSKNIALSFLLLTPLLGTVIYVMVKSPSTRVSPSMIVYIVASATFEEIAYRGIFESYIMRQIKDYKKLPYVIILMGLFFGFIHFSNFFFGQSLIATVEQMLGAFKIGIFYSGIFVLTGTIWPLCIAHFLNNYVYYMRNGTLESFAASSSSIKVLIIARLAIAIGLALIVFSSAKVQEKVKEKWSVKWGKNSQEENKESRFKVGSYICFLACMCIVTTALFICNHYTRGYIPDLLGEKGIYKDRYISEDYVVRTYYQKDGLFGSEKPIGMCSGNINQVKEFSVDIDNDGTKEFICQGCLKTDEKSYGEQSIIVYKKEGKKILIGTVPLMNLGLIDSREDIKAIFEAYDSDTNSILINYGALTEKYGSPQTVSLSKISYTEISRNIERGIWLNDK